MPGLRRCPWSQISNEVWIAYSWWRDWKDLNILPWGGNDLADQPNYVVDAIRQCEHIFNKVEAEQVDKSNKEIHKASNQHSTSGSPR